MVNNNPLRAFWTRKERYFKGASPVQWLLDSIHNLRLWVWISSRLIQNTRWKWVKSNARVESYTQFWFLHGKKNIASQMGQTDKKNILKRKIFCIKFSYWENKSKQQLIVMSTSKVILTETYKLIESTTMTNHSIQVIFSSFGLE
jgi:hypothetical protein